MYQVLEQTHEEKVKMYNENCTKEQLIEMIIECSEVIKRSYNIIERSYKFETLPHCNCNTSTVYFINGKNICTLCNKPLIQ